MRGSLETCSLGHRKSPSSRLWPTCSRRSAQNLSPDADRASGERPLQGYSRRPDGRARLRPLAAPSGRPRRSSSGFERSESSALRLDENDRRGVTLAGKASVAVEPIDFLDDSDCSLFDLMRPWPLSKATQASMVSRRRRSQFQRQNRLVGFALPKAKGVQG